jgi:DNA-binding NtrC family response regulator
MHSILVVDDEHSIREAFTLILEGTYKILLAATGEAAVKMVADQKFDLVYLDIRMPGMDGLETLRKIKSIDNETEIVMVTAVNDIQKASEAVRHGAHDYVVKPFDVDRISNLTEQILRRRSILRQGGQSHKNVIKIVPELIGQSEKVISVLNTIDKIKDDERVLIVGEAGTEKEIVAQMIHEKSTRSSFPFVSANLYAHMPLQKMRNAFFGFGKGESTANLDGKSGLFEQARKGTLFVNNLESLPVEIFETITELEFSRGASTARIPIEARMIGGALPGLEQKNRQIFEFFSQILIEIPPLRERSSDIFLLINHLLEKYSLQYEREIKVDPPALEVLTNYSWPGNSRQLENLLERLAFSSPGNSITLNDLPLDILLNGSPAGSEYISVFEKEYIKKAFEQNQGNKEKTAVFLGVPPVFLDTKI